MNEKLAILSTITGTTVSNININWGLIIGIPGGIFYLLRIYKDFIKKK